METISFLIVTILFKTSSMLANLTTPLKMYRNRSQPFGMRKHTLAHIFNIKLGVRTYSERGSYQNIPPGAAFTLNNWGNGHWNTSLTFLGTFAGKKYDTFTKDSVISKEEIKKILLTYTTGWKSILTSRHHLI